MDTVSAGKALARDLIAGTKKWALGTKKVALGPASIQAKVWVWFTAFMLITLTLLGGVFASQAQMKKANYADIAGGGQPSGGGGGDWHNRYKAYHEMTGNATGGSATTSERESTTLKANLNQTDLIRVQFTLTWTDEPDQSRHQNQPDTFILGVVSPWGGNSTNKGSNPRGGEGKVVVTFEVTQPDRKPPNTNGTGAWNVTVTLDSAGDQTPNIGPGILRTNADNSNAWELDVGYTYYMKGAGHG